MKWDYLDSWLPCRMTYVQDTVNSPNTILEILSELGGTAFVRSSPFFEGAFISICAYRKVFCK